MKASAVTKWRVRAINWSWHQAWKRVHAWRHRARTLTWKQMETLLQGQMFTAKLTSENGKYGVTPL
jgi:hypothetical protein